MSRHRGWSPASPHSFSRRGLLAGGGLAALGAALGACTRESGVAPDGARTLESTIVEDRSAEIRRVRWANWDAYIDLDDAGESPTLREFTDQTGLDVDYAAAVDDNDVFYEEIQPDLDARRDIGYDVVCFTDWAMSRLIRNGYCLELDEANLPNKTNILPDLLAVDYDPGRIFSIPWQGGYAGLVWNVDELPRGLATIEDLWRPELRGRVVVLSEMRDTIGLIMMSQGVDISSPDWGDAQFDAARAVLEQQLADGQVSQVRGNSYLDDLESGSALAAIAWSGDISSLNAEAGERWQWALPESGGTLWFDTLAVPITSPAKANAEILLNHYLDPQVAARVAAWVQFITPVAGAQEAMLGIDPDLAEDPLIFPTPEFLEQVRVFRALRPDEDARYSEDFALAIGG
ncbi:MAG: PotD/PotF family extracellular solute-binding protein [Kineosporiaceae bacterium]